VAAQNTDAPSGEKPEISLPETHEFQIEILEPDSYRKFCLTRLNNFVDLRSRPAEETPDDAQLHHRIVDRAIYSAFRDCVSAGAEAEARRILDEAAAPAA